MMEPRKVIIIGAGPAGLSCALWLKHMHLEPIIIERSVKLAGLQNVGNYENKWLIGFNHKTNQELAANFVEHIQSLDIEIYTQVDLYTVKKNQDGFKLVCDVQGQSKVLLAGALVLATGTRAQMHEAFEDVSGYTKLKNTDFLKFAFIPAEDFVLLRGKELAIVGGGDSAYEAAWMLAPNVKHLHLLVRSEPKAQLWQQQKVAALVQEGRITLYLNTEIESFDLHNNRARVFLAGNKNLDIDLLVPRTGFVPNIEVIHRFFPDIEGDQKNYIVVDPQTKETSIKNVYAIGDLIEPNNPCVATAIASGTQAARAIELSLRANKVSNDD